MGFHNAASHISGQASYLPAHVRTSRLMGLTKCGKQNLATSLARNVGIEQNMWPGSEQNNARRHSFKSRKVGPVNGETIDDSLVDHIFL